MTWRISFVFLCIVVIYFAFATRLFYWQVLRNSDIKQIAIAQSANSLTLPARRGDILSSDNFSLATNKISYLLYANPKVIKDKEEYIDTLSKLLSISESSISSRLNNNLYWIKIADNLDMKQKNMVEGLKLIGLGFQENSTRYYPESSMAAQLVGFVGKDNKSEPKGYFGIEGYYDAQLAGRDGKLYTLHDALGNTIINDIREEKKRNGRNIMLSLDRVIQFAVDKRLKEGIEKYQAEGGSVIILESLTGKVLAMSSYPKFDPQKYYEYDNIVYKNPVITNLYEPGSTFKVLVMAGAIDKGAVKADTKCSNCDGAVQIGEYSIRTWNDKYYPASTMTEVIQHSDNTGMVFVGQKLGFSPLLSYLKNFGIGELTGIDLQGEISGNIKDESEWYPIDEATVAFGQGISVTPIQLISAVNVIANGGLYIKPHTIEKIIEENGKVIDIMPEVKRRVISQTTAKVITEMMVNAVEKGEAKWTKLPDYKIAGKTGTAQIPIAGHYDPEKTITSFVGFFPADEPKITMLVVVDRPKAKIYGSETAAPIFFNIAKDLVTYYNIPPSY